MGRVLGFVWHNCTPISSPSFCARTLQGGRVAVKIIDCISEPESVGTSGALASAELPSGSSRAPSGGSGLSGKRPTRGMCAQVRLEQGDPSVGRPCTATGTHGVRSARAALQTLPGSGWFGCLVWPGQRAQSAVTASVGSPGLTDVRLSAMLPSSALQAAVVEALLARSMGHPHIVTTFAHGVGVEVSACAIRQNRHAVQLAMHTAA